jgi:hypothetical protein
MSALSKPVWLAIPFCDDSSICVSFVFVACGVIFFSALDIWSLADHRSFSSSI